MPGESNFPDKSDTGRAEPRTPIPITAVKGIEMIPSSIAFVTRIEESPFRPSAILPMIAMEPTQNKRLA